MGSIGPGISGSAPASSGYSKSAYVSRKSTGNRVTTGTSSSDAAAAAAAISGGGNSSGARRVARSSKSGVSTESGGSESSSESESGSGSGSALRGGTTVTTLLQDQGVKIPCSAFDQYTITVSKYTQSHDNLVAKSPTLKLLCMYVRREVRGLTTVDLSRTMEALRTVYRLGSTEGQGLYGPTYTSYTQLLQLFKAYSDPSSSSLGISSSSSPDILSTSANDATSAAASHRQELDSTHRQELDSTHRQELDSTRRQGLGTLSTLSEGTGFLSQRMRLTNLLEASLQSIDRSIAMPYWDYTIEGRTVASYHKIPKSSLLLSNPNPNPHSTSNRIHALLGLHH